VVGSIHTACGNYAFIFGLVLLLQRGEDNNSEKSSSFWGLENAGREIFKQTLAGCVALVTGSLRFWCGRQFCFFLAVHSLPITWKAALSVVRALSNLLEPDWLGKKESESESQLSAKRESPAAEDVSLFEKLHYYSPELLLICLLAV
jgi:hypothetical protein